MKALLAIAACLYCIKQGNGYFFPICTSEDETCTSYLNLLFPTSKDAAKVTQEVEQATQLTNFYFESIKNVLHPVTVFYGENVHPLVLQISRMASYVVPPLKSLALGFLKFVPFFNYEEKAKTDTNIYFFFIATSLGIYLVLYIYFTRKLYYYYQRSLRAKYLRRVKKIFKDPQPSQ